MIAISQRDDAHVLKFPSLLEQEEQLVDTGQPLTLRTYYEQVYLPEIASSQSAGARKEDRIALNHWERIIEEVDIRDVHRGHLVAFKDALQEGRSDATVNKTWRELESMFKAAVEDGILDRLPQIGRRMKGRLIAREQKQPQRQIVTEEELERLWLECRKATYPRNTQFPAPKLWRVALVLFWTYGGRTMDFLKHLRWDSVRFSDRLLTFTAQKTSKLQGLPLTPLVIEHLRSIKGHSERIFPGFNTKGGWIRSRGGQVLPTPKRKPGFYDTWNVEICGAAGLLEEIKIKHFRQRVVTRYNAISGGLKLGSWIAGHYMPGVSAQNYELPTDEIRELIETAPVPECFQQIG